MSLQSQERRNDQIWIVQWFQKGWIEAVSNLTGALTGYLLIVAFLSILAD